MTSTITFETKTFFMDVTDQNGELVKCKVVVQDKTAVKKNLRGKGRITLYDSHLRAFTAILPLTVLQDFQLTSIQYTEEEIENERINDPNDYEHTIIILNDNKEFMLYEDMESSVYDLIETKKKFTRELASIETKINNKMVMFQDIVA